MNRMVRGWALAEAVVAIALTAVVAAAALGGLAGLQRRAAGESERVAMASGLRTAVQVLHAELASVDAGAGDLIAAAPDRLTYRAVRGTGTGCGLAVDGVIVRTSAWRSLRLPVPGRDSLLALEDSGGWRVGPLTGPLRTAACPDGAAAMVLPTTMPVPLGGVTVIRTFEVMELRAYVSSGDGWLGMRSVSAGEAIQPVAGPFQVAPATFAFLDPAGTPVAGLAAVRQVQARFIGVTRTDAAAGAGSRADMARRDSVVAIVPLRGGSPP